MAVHFQEHLDEKLRLLRNAPTPPMFRLCGLVGLKRLDCGRTPDILNKHLHIRDERFRRRRRYIIKKTRKQMDCIY